MFVSSGGMAATKDARATILHADLDAFYASVEQLLDPSLRGKPIAVGGGGGVVLAASYEAKAFGVHGGMSGRRAREPCPGLAFVGGHFREYQRLGDDMVDVLRDFTPVVERISIDEAFLDVTGSVHLFGPPAGMASEIRRRVRDELGLPVSVGVATTKHLAKVASQVAKPDGLVVVEAGDEREFLDPLPVELLWGVGPVTRERLAGRGIRTIGALASTSPATLQKLLGDAVGARIGSLAANADPRRIETGRRAGSVGAQSALGRRVVSEQLLRAELGFLADRVATRLRAKGRAGRTVTVRVRFAGLRSVTRSVTLPWAISVSNLVPESALQLELDFDARVDQQHRPGTVAGAARWASDRALDRVRDRFGRGALGYGDVMFRAGRGVPDEFRELAEKDAAALPQAGAGHLHADEGR